VDPVFQPVVKPAEQSERMAVIGRVFLDLPERCKRRFVLCLVKLQFGLRQQHGVRCLGQVLVCLTQPPVAPFVLPQQVGGARRLQIIKEWRFADIGRPGKQALTLCKIPFRNLYDTACQSLARATYAKAPRRLPEFSRSAEEFYD
jgi:hypothetical protein